MLTTVNQIKLEGNLPDTVKDEILIPHLSKAEIEMKIILSPEKYTMVAALEDNNDEYKTCSIAEANLALSYAIPSLNIETQGSGIVHSKGWDESRSELLNQEEAERLQKHYREVAMDLLKFYIQQNNTSNKAVDVVNSVNYKLSAI
jgi:sulfur relay (sulfurtransferase) DsrC/TusE family protein